MTKAKIEKIIAVSTDSDIQTLARNAARQIFMADNYTEAGDILNTTEPDMIIIECDSDANITTDAHNFFNMLTNDTPIVAVATCNASDKLTLKNNIANIVDHFHITEADERLTLVINALNGPVEAAEASETADAHLFTNELAAAIGMAGTSQSSLKTSRMIELVANSNCNPILVVGETGTGKELVAKSLHAVRHAEKDFVALNCAALTANLLESELFGHVKGAFTGADKDKTGLLELASSGTIFLDEISEMPMELQAKLLRVLQEKTFRKVGGIKDITCHATIIASSNRNLKNEVSENRFRRDLYYRLNVCPITIAPLRSAGRKGDIRILTEYFLKTSTICPHKSDQNLSITKMALEALENYTWPGNVRELRNVIDRAILVESTDQIGMNSIIFEPDDIHEFAHEPTDNTQLKSFSLEKAEKELISKALKETDWQKTRAASLLGITRATLYAKIKQYDIKQSVTAEECESYADECLVVN